MLEFSLFFSPCIFFPFIQINPKTPIIVIVIFSPILVKPEFQSLLLLFLSGSLSFPLSPCLLLWW